MTAERPHRSLSGGWALVQRDPLGILLPAAAALLLEAAPWIMLRVCWDLLDPGSLAALFAGCWLAVAVAVGFPRALVLLAAGRALPVNPPPPYGDIVRTGLRLALVRAVVTLLALALVAIPLVPGLFLAAGLLERGLPLFAAIIAGAFGVLAALVALVVRAAFAYAPVEVAIGGRAPLPALRLAWEGGLGEWTSLAIVLLTGDLATGLGGALCGAGALPGYPLGDVAVLVRWARRDTSFRGV